MPDVPLNLLTREEIQRRLALGPPAESDASLLPRYRHPPERVPTPAAVLVPVVNRPTGLTLLLTQRTAHLHDHAGQISFPGGRVEDADPSRTHTALREAEEETGLHSRHVEIIGQLPEWDIQTGFRVTPVVGWVQPPFELAPDPFEVAEVFEVPLAFLLDPDNHRRHSDVVNGRQRHYYSMPYEGRYIWGATAGMIHTLYRILNR